MNEFKYRVCFLLRGADFLGFSTYGVMYLHRKTFYLFFPNLFFFSPDCTGLFGSMLNGKWRWMPHLVLCLGGMVKHLCQRAWCPLWARDLHQARAWIVWDGIFHLSRGSGNACLLFYSGGILLSRYEFHLVMVRYHLFRCFQLGPVWYRLLPM